MSFLRKIIAWLEAVPHSLLAIPLRFGVAWIFWSSAQVKLINWQRTIELFADEYRVPLLPPEIAAAMALSIEIACPSLLVLGLFTRLAVLVLLGMTAVLQIFVYPESWPPHLQWASTMAARRWKRSRWIRPGARCCASPGGGRAASTTARSQHLRVS